MNVAVRELYVDLVLDFLNTSNLCRPIDTQILKSLHPDNYNSVDAFMKHLDLATCKKGSFGNKAFYRDQMYSWVKEDGMFLAIETALADHDQTTTGHPKLNSPILRSVLKRAVDWRAYKIFMRAEEILDSKRKLELGGTVDG